MGTAKVSKRDQLIDTASRLFAAQGYRGTGIDQIAEEATVTKKTMYHHFGSKDELILAVLENYQGQYLAGFREQIEARTEDPRERLLGIFDVAGQWFAERDFRGCMVINAVAECATADARARQLSRQFKATERGYIEHLARKAGVPDPAALADALALLLEGAIVTAQISGQNESAQIARRSAECLLDCALAGR
ncbi:TetR/AcrR family transcriptional regulator [Gilvimarinus sp. F26214L]|uniref:TetR/AcrR family transcriptional regulator n=1 Tax=Gilvimarinus sp. DZF01 TaxID=3461371 RepID=UPI00404546B1